MKRAGAGVLWVLAAAVAAPQANVIQTFEHEGVARVSIKRAGIFDVSVKGTSGKAVRVEVRSDDAADKVQETRQGDELVIDAYRKDRVRSVGSRAPELVVRVPESTALSIETSSGGIDVETVTGAKDLSSSSGNIAVRSSRGRVDARSSTGNQKYDYVAGDVRGESATGAIELSNCEGSVSLRSATGRLWARSLRVSGDSSFRTSTGRIEIDFANPLDDFTFSLHSVTGLIEVGGVAARGKVEKGSGPLRITGQSTVGRQSYE